MRATEVADPVRPDEPMMVACYALDALAMAKTPLERRLIFRLAGVLNHSLFIHNALLQELRATGATGVRAFPVADFREGMQN